MLSSAYLTNRQDFEHLHALLTDRTLNPEPVESHKYETSYLQSHEASDDVKTYKTWEAQAVLGPGEGYNFYNFVRVFTVW